PVHRQHRLLGRLTRLLVGRAGRIGAVQPLWSGQPRLQRNSGIDRNPVELAETRAEQAQPLIGVVIAIKEQLCVGGVVVTLMKILELLVGQVRDVLRVAAGVETVSYVWIE